MLSFNAVAIVAFALSSLVAAAPTLTSPNSANLVSLSERDATSTVSATPAILLPISKANFTVSFGSALESLAKRDTTITSTPSTNVTLLYQSNEVNPIIAEVNATMKYPSVLLEDIESISAVDCSTTSVDITFSTEAGFTETLAAWPSSSFILFTNHLRDCDVDNERGLYVVSSLEFDNVTLTVTASTTQSSFDDSADDMSISFVRTTSAASKRDISYSFSAFPPSFSLTDSQDVTSEALSITVSDASLSGAFDLSGHVKYSFLEFKFTKAYLDVDLSVATAANIEVAATASYDQVWSYSPVDLSISAFSIAGILDVGPILSFQLGVEAAASGTVDISSDLTFTLSEGIAHLDLLDSSNTVTSGWTPAFTQQTNISAAIEAQVNPYVSVTAEIGISFLGGLLDLSAGINAKPELLNVFDINGQFDISNDLNIIFPVSTEDTCENSLWYTSEFVFTVTGFVTQFYSVSLYEVEVPIYESGCWSWLDAVMNSSN
ncbi:hypothetical protein N431DRAFT_467441 [Stipitochalara longipes BDJ]|nr:hypothetical protein N431DRAFT_467441 [Stipitochalara longipes BDJ]